MNDALLSGSLHFASGGVGAVRHAVGQDPRQLQREGRGRAELDAAVPQHANPNVKTIKDFTDKDKIALPAVKVSIQAVTLQMAAEQAFGPGQQNKLDSLTVSMSHPDAQMALLSGAARSPRISARRRSSTRNCSSPASTAS